MQSCVGYKRARTSTWAPDSSLQESFRANPRQSTSEIPTNNCDQNFELSSGIEKKQLEEQQ